MAEGDPAEIRIDHLLKVRYLAPAHSASTLFLTGAEPRLSNRRQVRNLMGG